MTRPPQPPSQSESSPEWPDPGPRSFDPLTGRPLRGSGAGPEATGWFGPGSIGRGLNLVVLHMVVFVLAFAAMLVLRSSWLYSSELNHLLPRRAIIVIFFAWGTLIGFQLGTVLVRGRRLAGGVLFGCAALSAAIGLWDLVFALHPIPVWSEVFVILVAVVAVGLSIVRRPPSLLIEAGYFPIAAAAPAHTPPSEGPFPRAMGPRIARRGWLVSIPNVVLGLFAVVFLIGSFASATLNVLEVRGTGKVVSQTSRLGEFDAVSMPGMGTLEVEYGPSYEITISGDSNIVGRINRTVSGGTLALTFDAARGSTVRLKARLVIRIQAPTLTSIFLNGDSTIAGGTQLRADGLRIVAEDIATIPDLQLAGRGASIVVRNDATASVSGTVTTLGVDVLGNARIDAGDVSAHDVAATVGGNGSARVSAAERLTYSQRDDGRITYDVAANGQLSGTADAPENVLPERVTSRPREATPGAGG